jgi:NAD(P)H-flavin reductase
VTNLHDISQIFICGPPVMSTALVKAMDVLRVPQEKYYIL